MLDQVEPILTDEELESIREQVRYVVRLPVFEGPLDLLLHLIEKRQMEITTISLMAVTDQYLAYLRQWQEMSGQPEQCGRGESSGRVEPSGPLGRVEPSGQAEQAGRAESSGRVEPSG